MTKITKNLVKIDLIDDLINGLILICSTGGFTFFFNL
jgi:hypothetical protein